MSKPTSVGIHQGDTISFPVSITDPSTGTPTILTDAVIRSDLRKEYKQDVIASFTIVNTDLLNGLFELTMDATTSAALPMNRDGSITSFVWDGQIRYVGGQIETFVSGYVKVTPEVTQGV